MPESRITKSVLHYPESDYGPFLRQLLSFNGDGFELPDCRAIVAAKVASLKDGKSISSYLEGDYAFTYEMYRTSKEAEPPADVEGDAKRLLARAAKSRTQEALVRMEASPSQSFEILRGLMKEVEEAGTASSRPIDANPLLETARHAVDRYEHMHNNRGRLGIPYGIDKLDHISGGMKPGQTIVVAGVTGGGKSTLGLHMIKSALTAGYGVGLFSLEMDRNEIFDLIMADVCSVDRNKFNTGFFAEADFPLLTGGLGKLQYLPLFIEDEAETTVEDIKARVLQLRSRIDLPAFSERD